MPATFNGACPVPSVWYVCPVTSPAAKAAALSACAARFGNKPDCRLCIINFLVKYYWMFKGFKFKFLWWAALEKKMQKKVKVYLTQG